MDISPLAYAYSQGLEISEKVFSVEIDKLRTQVANLEAQLNCMKRNDKKLTTELQGKLDEALAVANRAEMRDEVVFEITIHVWNAFISKRSWAVAMDEHNGRIALYTEVLRRTQLYIETHPSTLEPEYGVDDFWETIDIFNQQQDKELETENAKD